MSTNTGSSTGQSLQNQILYEGLKELAKSSFDLINGGTIFYVNRECITITDGGGGSRWIDAVPSFELSLVKIKEEILALPEFVQCVDRVHEIYDVPEGTEIEDLLLGFLCKLAEASVVSNTPVRGWKPLSLDFDVYATTYKSFEDDLSSGNLMLTLAPLRGFELQAGEVDLGCSFRIRKVTPDELVQLWYGHEQMSGFWNSNEFSRIRFCITQEHPIGIAFDSNGFDTIVTALRLWKTGNVGYDTLYSLPKWSGIGGSFMGGTSIYFGHPPVTFESTDLEQFKNFYTGFRSRVIDSPQFLRTAIQRFNDSYQRMRREDELLDNVIGLEALVSEASGDLSWKVSRRTARLLETDPARREEVSDNVKWAYNARNNIAHGNKPVTSIKIKLTGNKAQNLPLHESVPVIREYLRRSINKFIVLGQGKGQILNNLDFGA